MTANQANVLAALKGQITSKRRWLSLAVLASYDGRTVRALHRAGLIEINPDYGVRVVKEAA
jgi:hypothetical protein